MSRLVVTLGPRPRCSSDALAALQREAYLASGVSGAPWSAAAFEGVVLADGAMVVEAWRGLRLAGVAVARTIFDESELLTISRSTEVVGLGVGSLLLATMLDALASRRVARLLLETAAANTSAQRLYAAFGFAKVGVRRGYYAFPDQQDRDALILEKCLACRE